MTTAFLQLGKVGDILNAIPLAQFHARETGIKPYFIVADQYADILERIPHVVPVIYENSWDDLRGAMLWAKRQFETVIVTQTYGRNMPIEHRCSSWQLDAYERAGRLKDWDKLTLEVERSAAHLGATCKSPTIFYADHSQSSPFFQKEELYKLLVDSFPLHAIIRLSSTRLSNFCDFVHWYDSSDAIVCVESAHLHLTKACSKPVVALATDKPSKWHGSAWSKRYAYYCRYSEFSERKMELVEALSAALEGRKKGEEVVLNG